MLLEGSAGSFSQSVAGFSIEALVKQVDKRRTDAYIAIVVNIMSYSAVEYLSNTSLAFAIRLASEPVSIVSTAAAVENR